MTAERKKFTDAYPSGTVAMHEPLVNKVDLDSLADVVAWRVQKANHVDLGGVFAITRMSSSVV